MTAFAESPASFIKVYEQIKKNAPGGSGGGTAHETGHIQRQLDLKEAEQGIYAHIAAASGLGKPAELVADEIVDAFTRASAVLQEEQREAPLAEALELVPEDDGGALDSTGAAARAPELADNGGFVTSCKTRDINVGIKEKVYD